jgi:hypothetical protein
MGYYLHHVPGRIRIKIPQIKHRPDQAGKIREMLKEQGGISQMNINLSTGSVVVYYDPETLTATQILTLLKHNGFFDEAMTYGAPEEIDRISSKACETFGKAIFGWTVGRILDANGLSFLAAFI